MLLFANTTHLTLPKCIKIVDNNENYTEYGFAGLAFFGGGHYTTLTYFNGDFLYTDCMKIQESWSKQVHTGSFINLFPLFNKYKHQIVSDILYVKL